MMLTVFAREMNEQTTGREEKDSSQLSLNNQARRQGLHGDAVGPAVHLAVAEAVDQLQIPGAQRKRHVCLAACTDSDTLVRAK
jgi:hypothetical protein